MLYYTMRTAAFRGSVCSLIGGSRLRAGVLGGLVGISFILIVTTISSSAGPENGRIHPSPPAFSVMGNHAVVTSTRVMGHALSYTGYRTAGARNFSPPMVVAPQRPSNPETEAQNATSAAAEPRTQEATHDATDPNPS